MSNNKKTAIVLFNLGGPDSLESVKGFLFNLFNDPKIIRLPQPFRFALAKFISSKREKKAQEIYKEIGGKSPLLELTQNQAKTLEIELSKHGDFRTFIAMRYHKPFSKDAIVEIEKYAPDEIILLPLYPQFSDTTSGSSIADFKKNYHGKATVKTLCCYPTETNFIKAHSNLIQKTISEGNVKDSSKLRLLFSAHGLPQKIVDAGDPYVEHVTATVNAVMKNFENLDSVICYQSKVGRLQWTSPSLDDEIKRVALDKKIPVIIPIAFVSEHSETLVELDIEYREIAEELGIEKYLRVPALNSHPDFIHGLTEITLAASKSDEKFLSNGRKERFCPKKFKFCQNPCQN